MAYQMLAHLREDGELSGLLCLFPIKSDIILQDDLIVWLILDGTDAIHMQTTKGIIIILHITWDRWDVVVHGYKVVDHYAALSLFKHQTLLR
ncbi:hypothetical protein K1719_003228 [Acacia pycnantha]|nr:hypothetical protein K1719_003228 [Acacia pycnantha]